MRDFSWKEYVTGRHDRLIKLWAERLDLQTTGFRQVVPARLALEPWGTDGEWDGTERTRFADMLDFGGGRRMTVGEWRRTQQWDDEVAP